MKNTQQGSSTIGMIALVAIALLVGIWIQAETEIVNYETSSLNTPSFMKKEMNNDMMMEADNNMMEPEENDMTESDDMMMDDDVMEADNNMMEPEENDMTESDDMMMEADMMDDDVMEAEVTTETEA